MQETVTEVIDDINGEVRRHSAAHTKAKFRIKRLSEWKELREVDVHAGARAQDFEKTVTALAALAGCGIEVAERAVLNENPGAVQIIAKAAGCVVVGIDINPKANELATAAGAALVVNPSEPDWKRRINDFTGKNGVDATVICASSDWSEAGTLPAKSWYGASVTPPLARVPM